MAIQTSDIKLLQSAVMADTSDGGGQMSGVQVVDGASNNLFPDTSAMDRAFGRVNMRKVFGVALSTDTSTLMGSHAIITSAPADPLVSCTLMKTNGWGDDRSTARSVIESYMVKGTRYASRIYDTHYAGALQLRMYSFVNAGFPAGGDAIVIHLPTGAEQYVRVLRTAISVQNIAVTEGASTLILPATICICDLGQALSWDVPGPPAGRVIINEYTLYACAYNTVVATGSKFYGIKPLGVAGSVGDITATTSGGMYAPLVPAATVESAITDKYPLLGRASVISTAAAAVSTPSVTFTLGPGVSVYMPTSIEPKSISMVHGGTTFTDSASGDGLYQGATRVADVDYATGIITFTSSSPSYGSGANVTTYRPATVVGASAYANYLKITSANQGLVFTSTFLPAPAPGSFKVSYMAQGRWYDLTDNLVGKLSGLDSSYGVGTIAYNSGSMALTLGAIPDIDSLILASWGDPQSAKQVTNLPTQAYALLPLPEKTDSTKITITWSNGGTNYTASTNAQGVLTGGATGRLKDGGLQIFPTVFPSGGFHIAAYTALTLGTAYSGSGSALMLTGGTPIAPGTVRGSILADPTWYDSYGRFSSKRQNYWDENGVLYCSGDGQGYDRANIGLINYSTGQLTFATSVNVLAHYVVQNTGGAWTGYSAYYTNVVTTRALNLSLPIVTSYSYGSATLVENDYTPLSWTMDVPVQGLLTLLSASMCFKMGTELYTGSAGSIRKGWSVATGVPATSSAGTVQAEGSITIIPAALPINSSNSVVWYNCAQDAATKKMLGGVFRTDSAPLKTGVFQLHTPTLNANASDAGVLSGDFTGTADFQRGVITWQNANGIDPTQLAYNAVFLQYLPLDVTLLGLDTARLPLDGKVPIFRVGDLVVIHNTLTFNPPNPVVKTTVYSLGRTRIANVRVKDALGTVVPDTLYTVDLNLGTFMVPTASNITAYTQPFSVEHRIEDMLLVSQVDISGKLTFTRSLTHAYPANSSYISGAMPFGDLFARAYNVIEQSTWTSVWSDTLIGPTIIPQFNTTLYPIVITNQGAIKERWVMIFTNTTSFRVIGESVGEIGVGTIGAACSPVNPATGVPYFTLPALAWGSGWSTGNCLRFNTDAAGMPFWTVRTVLQGPASLDSDKFTLAFRGDVDRP